MRIPDPRSVLSLLFLLLLVAAGCDTNGTSEDDDDATGDDDDDDDSPCDAEFVVSEVVGTVVTVRWDPGVAAVDEAYVEYGEDGVLDLRAPARAAAEGGLEAVVLGLRTSTDYDLRTVVVVDSSSTACEPTTVTTGPLPSSLPDLDWYVTGAGESTPGFLLTSFITTPPTPVILDTEGNVVWWYEMGDGFPSAMSRLIQSVDGESFIVQLPSEGDLFENPGDVLRVSYDGTRTEVIEGAGEGHHDMLELPDGTLAILHEDWREVEGENAAGDRIVEVQPDGSHVEIWNIWDWESYPDETDFQLSWSHANALDYDPAEDVYYASMRNLNAIYKIDRATGDLLWKLGDEGSDFALPGGNTEFSFYQHQFHPLGDEIVIFDNGNPEGYDSRIVHYGLDEATGSAELLWEYHSVPPVYNYGLGDVTRLDSGNTLVTWSTSGQLEEVTIDGAPVWHVSIAEIGAGFAYTTFVESLYVPPSN
jgi:hypothetical protein